MAGGLDCVDRSGEIAIGSVLEAQRHGQAGCHLPVGLALGGAGSDRGPTDQVGDILGRNGIEKFGCRRQAEIQDIAEKGTGEMKAAVDVAGVIEVRIHDQSLPTDRCPRLLEIDPHDEKEAIGHLPSQIGQALSVFATGLNIVDRAWTDDDEEAVIVTEDDAMYLLTGPGDQVGLICRRRNLGQQVHGPGQDAGVEYIDVGCLSHSVALSRTGIDCRGRIRHCSGLAYIRKAGRLPLSDPPIAFLVTPKSPAKRRKSLKLCLIC